MAATRSPPANSGTHAYPPPPPHLVEAEERDLAADIDAWRTDAEDALLLQPALGVDGSRGDGGRQGGRHCDGHQIQAPDHQLPPSHLDTRQHLALELGMPYEDRINVRSLHLHCF